MRLGVSDLEDETAGVTRKVVKSFTHPKYVSPPYFDVGVAEADEVIEFVNKVRPICLPMRPIDDYDAFVGKLHFNFFSSNKSSSYSHWNMKLKKQYYFGTFCDTNILFARVVKPT